MSNGYKIQSYYSIIILTYIHNSIHTSPFAEARLLVWSSDFCSGRGASMGCRAEIWTRACLTVHHADELYTNWAAPHPNWATPAILLSCPAPYWYWTTRQCRTLLSYAAPYTYKDLSWARSFPPTLHQVQRCYSQREMQCRVSSARQGSWWWVF